MLTRKTTKDASFKEEDSDEGCLPASLLAPVNMTISSTTMMTLRHDTPQPKGQPTPFRAVGKTGNVSDGGSSQGDQVHRGDPWLGKAPPAQPQQDAPSPESG